MKHAVRRHARLYTETLCGELVSGGNRTPVGVMTIVDSPELADLPGDVTCPACQVKVVEEALRERNRTGQG